MRASRAFTLIEVMAVVTLLGLAAGAVAWSLADDARHSRRVDALTRLRHADHACRLAARRVAGAVMLRFDLDQQTIRRVVVEGGVASGGGVTSGGGGRMEVGHTTALPVGVRLAAVRVLNGGGDAGSRRAGTMHSGVAEVPMDAAGRSASYAVRLVDAGGERGAGGAASWTVVAGATGQVLSGLSDEQVDAISTMLAAGGPDAD